MFDHDERRVAEALERIGAILEAINDALWHLVRDFKPHKAHANGSALTITGDTMATLTQTFYSDFPGDTAVAPAPAGDVAAFASSDDTIATVDASGVITDVAAGTVTFSCANSGGTNADGSAYAGADPEPIEYTTAIVAPAANGSVLSIV